MARQGSAGPKPAEAFRSSGRSHGDRATQGLEGPAGGPGLGERVSELGRPDLGDAGPAHQSRGRGQLCGAGEVPKTTVFSNPLPALSKTLESSIQGLRIM